MNYTARLGDKPTEAHVNYDCPCGCKAGLIYDRESGSTELGQCCCGRLLWVGDKADSVIELLYEDGIEYVLDLGSVTLPWGDSVPAALAVPADEAAKEGGSSVAAEVAGQMEQMVYDVVCGMPVDPRTTTLRSEFLDKTYYFCNQSCKERFDLAPQIYALGGGR